MKFLVFADLHYDPGFLYGTDWSTLKAIQKRAEDNGCDFIIHAGDFCYGPSTVPEYVEAYNNFHIPSYHCLGNHDCDNTPYEETLRYFNMSSGNYYFDCKGYRMIVLDTNYCKIGDTYVNYSMRNYRDYPDGYDNIPPEQLKWLEETIDSSAYPCLIISHASCERELVVPKDDEELIQLTHEANACKNFEEVRQIIRNANAKSPNKVLLVMNGHHHHDFLRLLDNVLYWDINSTTYDWVCAKAHDYFPEDFCKEHVLANHTIAYNEPLTAVVTLDGTTITIEGSESTYFMGVTREMVGDFVLDRSGRPTRPKIQSAKLTLL